MQNSCLLLHFLQGGHAFLRYAERVGGEGLGRRRRLESPGLGLRAGLGLERGYLPDGFFRGGGAGRAVIRAGQLYGQR